MIVVFWLVLELNKYRHNFINSIIINFFKNKYFQNYLVKNIIDIGQVQNHFQNENWISILVIYGTTETIFAS